MLSTLPTGQIFLLNIPEMLQNEQFVVNSDCFDLRVMKGSFLDLKRNLEFCEV